jgi:hypothetical protein
LLRKVYWPLLKQGALQNNFLFVLPKAYEFQNASSSIHIYMVGHVARSRKMRDAYKILDRKLYG